MDRCNAVVIQHVPYAFDYKVVESKCGETGVYGQTLQCEKCEAKGRPWGMCEHGVDISEREMACERCNAKYE